MIKSITKKTNNKKGFTLIELIVVIAILGILAAIAIPRLGAFRGSAETRANEANIRVITVAAQMWMADDIANVTLAEAEEPAVLDPYLDEWPIVPGTTDGKYSVKIEAGGVITVTP